MRKCSTKNCEAHLAETISLCLLVNRAPCRYRQNGLVLPGGAGRDQWDYDAVAPIILADLAIRGRARKVLMHAPKDGFFYVLDRVNGSLLSAAPYVPVTWASRVDKVTGRPVLTEQANYSRQPRLVFPSTAGGHLWQPMAFNPTTKLAYIPTIEAGDVFWMPSQPFVYELEAGTTDTY